MDFLYDILDEIERIPGYIAWGSFVLGAVVGGLAIAASLKHWYGVLLLLIGVPLLFVGLAILMPPGLVPGYTLMFYVVGLAILIGIAVYIN